MTATAVVLLTTAVVVIVALLIAAAAGKLARINGATYPTALNHAATAFAGTVTLVAALTAALAAVFR
ncbi:hypothetical protein QA811_43005 [Streptomyces sp. B21-102]|uniref:hypothetical protein n=1 Tax=unclassified Streptomyces TaxID=2593676 RepID=UPI002FF3ADB8